MNLDAEKLFETLDRHKVAFMLIGGMNFLLQHQPVLTLDMDIWIEDTPENRHRCEQALLELEAEWGTTEAEWGPVAKLSPGWLLRQRVFSLLTRAGPLDVFRAVAGLADWLECRQRASVGKTASGVTYVSLSDEDMLACQYALDEGCRKLDRIRFLEGLLRHESSS